MVVMRSSKSSSGAPRSRSTRTLPSPSYSKVVLFSNVRPPSNQNSSWLTMWRPMERPREATVSTPIAWDEVDDVQPHDCTIATVPQRFAELGDLHAGIDEAVFNIEPLLEWAERDERAGRETPKVPPEG